MNPPPLNPLPRGEGKFTFYEFIFIDDQGKTRWVSLKEVWQIRY